MFCKEGVDSVGKFSKGSGSRSTVDIKGADAKDDFAIAWQSVNTEKSNDPEVLVLKGMEDIKIESTGSKMEIVEMASVMKAEEDDRRWWEKVGDWFGGVGDWFTGKWEELGSWVVGTVLGAALGALIAYIGGVYADFEEEDKDNSTNAPENKTKLNVAEVVTRVVKFDINKFINEKAQTTAFGKTFGEMSTFKESKGIRDKIGAAVKKSASIDIINSVINKPLQVAALGQTLEAVRKEGYDKQYKERGKMSDGSYRMQVDKVKNDEGTTRAHALNAVVTLNIFTKFDEFLQTKILGDTFNTIESRLDTTEKMFTAIENAQSMDQSSIARQIDTMVENVRDTGVSDKTTLSSSGGSGNGAGGGAAGGIGGSTGAAGIPQDLNIIAQALYSTPQDVENRDQNAETFGGSRDISVTTKRDESNDLYKDIGGIDADQGRLKAVVEVSNEISSDKLKEVLNTEGIEALADLLDSAEEVIEVFDERILDKVISIDDNFFIDRSSDDENPISKEDVEVTFIFVDRTTGETTDEEDMPDYFISGSLETIISRADAQDYDVIAVAEIAEEKVEEINEESGSIINEEDKQEESLEISVVSIEDYEVSSTVDEITTTAELSDSFSDNSDSLSDIEDFFDYYEEDGYEAYEREAAFTTVQDPDMQVSREDDDETAIFISEQFDENGESVELQIVEPEDTNSTVIEEEKEMIEESNVFNEDAQDENDSGVKENNQQENPEETRSNTKSH